MFEQAVLESRNLKRRFCKDNNIPITVYENPYFMQRLKLFDPFYNTLRKWRGFTDMLFDFTNEQSYFVFCDGIINQAVADITSKRDYQSFNYMTILKYGDTGTMIVDGGKSSHHLKRTGRRNVYVPESNGKWFVSIDMCKANFNALRIFAKEIVDCCPDWETFISQYTTYPAIINSKYIRQVILGKCNPKRIANYEQFLMEELAYDISMQFPKNPIEFYSVAGDEIILVLEPEDDRIEKVKGAVKRSGLADCVKVEHFTVNDLNFAWSKAQQPKLGYVKVPLEGHLEFKCVSADVLPQVIRYQMSGKIRPEDLIFVHDGKLAQFLEPVIK